MPPRPQFSLQQRNFLVMEYHRRKGTRSSLSLVIRNFLAKFPGVRRPSKNGIRKLWKKQNRLGTVNNCNSKHSPGNSNSGKRFTIRTPAIQADVKRVMDRDAPKRRGDPNVSPINSARRNILGLAKSSWSRICGDLQYHPYRIIRRHELKEQDPPRRLIFCNWLITLSDQELLNILWSDEANFHLCGSVNSQNVRRYAPLRSSDRVGGGRPDHFTLDTPNHSPKVMVFCGIRRGGTFGLKFYRNESMNSQMYHALLQHHVLPEIRVWNGGSLNNLVWMQDGAPCHVTDMNMRYLDRQFQDRVVSRRPVRGRDWPARSPDLNPCDTFLWGYLKSKVYCPRPTTLDQLESNIRREVVALDTEMLLRVVRNIRTRAEKCIAANGGHFEN